MRDRDAIVARNVLLAAIIMLLATRRASAYVGPGAGLEFLGYFLSLLVLVVTAFSTILLWPVYAFVRWMRGGKTSPVAGERAESDVPKDQCTRVDKV
jgi:hypothetical protein